MKRSKTIQPSLLQKRDAKLLPPGNLKPLCVATALSTLALVGCSRQVTVEPTEVETFTSVADCVASGKHTEQACNNAYKDARVESQLYGPRFNSLAECEAEFGTQQCTRYGQSSGGTGIIGPLIAGFVIAEVVDEIGDALNPRYRNYPVYRHKKRFNEDEYVFGDGTILGSTSRGSYRINTSGIEYGKAKSSFKTKPAVTTSVTKTVSKGGFGSSSSAKSSWGSGSRSSGWGG